MTRTAGRRRKKHHESSAERSRRTTSDAAVYGGLLLIGGFVILLVWLLSEGALGRPVTLGYIIALAYLVNFYTFQVYRGRKLLGWQEALVHIPLRFVGYGTRQGKPLEAAHGQPAVRVALLLSVAVSVVIILVATYLLIPSARL